MATTTRTRRPRRASNKARANQTTTAPAQATEPKPAAKKQQNPASLYALSDFPATGQEMVLYPVSARVDIVLTPFEVAIRNLLTDSGLPYQEFTVEANTDRNQYVKFKARTVPGMEDEIRLASKPVFV